MYLSQMLSTLLSHNYSICQHIHKNSQTVSNWMGVLMFQNNFSYKNRPAKAANSWSNSRLKHNQVDICPNYQNEGGQQ